MLTAERLDNMLDAAERRARVIETRADELDRFTTYLAQLSFETRTEGHLRRAARRLAVCSQQLTEAADRIAAERKPHEVAA